jgi:heparan-alpha-glucosaminide N-acetyltransferase
MNQLPKRLHSIDVFRAITMLLMIFVNDVSGVKHIPEWIEHVDGRADGLGFADTVFPAFLFIVGLSLPFAISRRLEKDESFLNIALYIVTRSFALIVMGFYHVNGEEYSSAAILPRAVWMLVVTTGFFLVWLDYAPTMKRNRKYALVALGAVLLIAMAILYKGGDPAAPRGMRPSWWGILGIIGWSYLVCAAIFLVSKGRLPALITALLVFVLINLGSHTGVLDGKLFLVGDASSVSLVMAGAVISGIYASLAGKGRDRQLWMVLTACGFLAIAAGFLVRPFADGISKIRSTPAWVFICTGISILVFEGLIGLVDAKRKQGWFAVIRPGGTSTLTCYLLPYLLYSILSILHFRYPAFLSEGAGGLICSICVGFLIISIVGVMERYRLRLKI